jgi:DNA-directed RNA polymerase subunit H (RpoH/RPB5)
MSDIPYDKLYIIYTNAHNMLRDRGYTMINQISNLDDFIKAYKRKMIFISDKDRKVILHISKENPTFDKKKSFIKKNYVDVMKNISKGILSKSLIEVIIVTNTPLKKKMISYIEEDSNSKKVSIYYIYYRNLMINLPKHTYVPKHELLMDIEIKDLYKNSTFKKSNLRSILETDPVAIWYNAREGDVFKITRKDNVTIVGKNIRNDYINNLEEIVYAKVVKNTEVKLYV